MTKFSEVAKHYIGGPIIIYFEDEKGAFTDEFRGTLSWHWEEDEPFYIIDPKASDKKYDHDDYEETNFQIKPILRPLSSMTEGDAIELAKLSELGSHFNDVKIERGKLDNDIIVTWQGSNESRERFNATGELFYCADQFQWLLKKNFDVFSLVESGQAIDATTLPASGEGK